MSTGVEISKWARSGFPCICLATNTECQVMNCKLQICCCLECEYFDSNIMLFDFEYSIIVFAFSVLEKSGFFMN
jgi:hypothetical protein